MYDVDNKSWSESSKDKAYFCDPMGFAEEGGTGGGGHNVLTEESSGKMISAVRFLSMAFYSRREKQCLHRQIKVNGVS